jgi:NADPH:quinone reductase-like Zn-dependent oxidoreductase
MLSTSERCRPRRAGGGAAQGRRAEDGAAGRLSARSHLIRLLRIRSKVIVGECFEVEANREGEIAMKTVRFHEYGDPDVLRYEDADQPVPGAGQVRLRVAATTFNGVDANIRGGNMQGPIPVELPHSPGIDVAGTVDALGEGVDSLAVGDQVIGFLPMGGPGASAEYVIAPAEVLAAAPTTVPLADAAALPAVGLTAWQALFDHAKLTAGQRILLNGAGGAVGGYAVQLAANAGAHVIATASPSSGQRVKASGAEQVVDHTTADVTAEVTEPVDVVLNLAPVEPAQLSALVALIRDGGTLVNTTVWMPAPSDDKRNVKGIDLYARSDARQLAQLVAQVDAGHLRIDIAERVPLADLPALHARAATGALPSGKVTVTVAA